MPVSADLSGDGSLTSLMFPRKGLGAVQWEHWGDKRKRQDEAEAPGVHQEGFVTTKQLSEALAEFHSTVSH
eukprot:5027282-Karenia_brevis.AAC.1